MTHHFGRVLVVIVNYRSAALTLAALRSLLPERERLGLTLEARVVENASGDAEALTEGLSAAEFRSWVTLDVAPRNGGFAYGNNRGVEYGFSLDSVPDYFYFLNPDARVEPGAAVALLGFLAEHPRAGIVGSALENGDGSPHHIAYRFPSTLSEVDSGLRLGLATRLLNRWVVPREMGAQAERVDWVTGASFAVRREVFAQIGGLDEGYFLYFEETDFCRTALEAGWECWYVPDSRVAHLEGATTGVNHEGAEKRRLPSYWFESPAPVFFQAPGGIGRGGDGSSGRCLSSRGGPEVAAPGPEAPDRTELRPRPPSPFCPLAETLGGTPPADLQAGGRLVQVTPSARLASQCRRRLRSST